MLKVGDKAPDFELGDKDGKKYSLKGATGKGRVVLYFYPKDNTPGCTIEAHEFNRDHEDYARLNVKILGIGGGDDLTKQKFCEKNKLDLTLLSDPEFKVSSKYGVYGEKSFMGRKFMGIHRITYVIGEGGKILKVFDKVKPMGHSQEVINYLEDLK
jgi:thioredoxin-dependent peroxiredoxin